MVSVVVIGYGNVAYHLVNAFLKAKTINLVGVYARDISKIKHLDHSTAITDNMYELGNADAYIIAISDDAIPLVSSKIKNKSPLIVHTSGAIAMNQLKTDNRKGVFYPLQSFSKNKEIDFDRIPFCLETEYKADYTILENIAKAIGKNIYLLNSAQRKQLHVAAVFVNNFTNHLFKIGNDVCNKNNIPFEILFPLIEETALKITKISPKEAQTGPAIRNDKETINNHLNLLNNEEQAIYKLLTKSIQNNG